MKNIHITPKEDWIRKNPQCRQIESCSKSLSKKCICPKEEPKQENTLEKSIEQELENHFFSNISEIKQAKYFINFGIKLQQEQYKDKFGDEEVIDSIQYTINNFFNGKLAGLNSEEIFEKFKKK